MYLCVRSFVHSLIWWYRTCETNKFLLKQVVLCFSPVGSTLRRRARKFPAIINCTAINFFYEWPKSALESVAKKFLLKVDVLPVRVIKVHI